MTEPMSTSQMQAVIDAAWERRTEIGTATKGEVRDAVEAALEGLDNGSPRVATPTGDHQWTVNRWLRRPCCCRSGCSTWW